MIIYFGDITLPVFFTSQDEARDIVRKILRALRLPVETRCGVSFMNANGYVIKMSSQLPDNTQLMMLYSPVSIQEEKEEKEESEKMPHQSSLLWLVSHLNPEIPSEILLQIAMNLTQLFKREYYCWDMENASEMEALDTLGTSIINSSSKWPFYATTITGPTSKNQSICWRIQFDKVPLHFVHYLYLGVIHSDELGFLQYNPRLSTVPTISKEANSRIYDVIIQDGVFFILEVPNRVIAKGRLNPVKEPTIQCPLLLAVWSKIDIHIRIIKVSHQRVVLTKEMNLFPISEFHY